jgi:hypothetical protein
MIDSYVKEKKCWRSNLFCLIDMHVDMLHNCH